MFIVMNYGSWDKLAIIYKSLCYFEFVFVLLLFVSSLFLLFLLLLLLPLGYIFCIQST